VWLVGWCTAGAAADLGEPLATSANPGEEGGGFAVRSSGEVAATGAGRGGGRRAARWAGASGSAETFAGVWRCRSVGRQPEPRKGPGAAASGHEPHRPPAAASICGLRRWPGRRVRVPRPGQPSQARHRADHQERPRPTAHHHGNPRSAHAAHLRVLPGSITAGRGRSPGGSVVDPLRRRPRSVGAVDRDLEGRTDVPHTGFGQPAQPAHEDCDRDALDRVQVDRRTPRDGIVNGFEDNLAGEPSDRCCAGSDERASEPWDRAVTGQHDDGASTDLHQLAPPHLPPGRKCDHEAAAARRNDARSPHSSGSSAGCSS